MELLWPEFLPLMGFILLLGALYIGMLRRRRRFVVRYSSLALVREALPHQAYWRRHLPFALFLLALVSLVLALGRPVVIIPVPTDQTTIMLAIDTSGSMGSVDIPPNRLAAANTAALSFIQRQKARTQIGLVAFSDFAALVQPPTTDQEALQTAISSLITALDGTAIGSGILKSLDAIATINKNVAPSVSDPSSGLKPTPMPKGMYAPDIIVLLTDGENTSGPLPLDAAQQAADRGVCIYTIGYGRVSGSRLNGGFQSDVDEKTLKQIAAMTGGAYYAAASEGDLHHVFDHLPTYLIAKHEMVEISVAFAAFGALLATLAIGLSLLWHPLA